ncbi:divergent PAP2 family protein [Desulfothermobacter acidiphilus]|uniref:divergent PAP2 family protein n=1 Tax=Desulfothermobacter acidiphilus TaxID=1938353 RepID=UPI003F8ABDA3
MLHYWFLAHKLILAPLAACWVTQGIKSLLAWRREHRWSWEWLYADGGMPSAHSAMVSALAVAVGLCLGFDSAEFALALVFAFIVWHDAMGVRRVAGKHSHLLRELVQREELETAESDLPRGPVGHTPQEVLVGACIGALVAFFLLGHGHLVWYLAKRWGAVVCHSRAVF